MDWENGSRCYKLMNWERIISVVINAIADPWSPPMVWSSHNLEKIFGVSLGWLGRTEIYVDTDWGEGSDHQPSHVRRGLVTGHPWSGCSSWDEGWPGGPAWASQIDISRQTQTRGTSPAWLGFLLVTSSDITSAPGCEFVWIENIKHICIRVQVKWGQQPSVNLWIF